MTSITWNLQIKDILMHISLLGSSLTLVIKGEISELRVLEALDEKKGKRGTLLLILLTLRFHPVVRVCSSFITKHISRKILDPGCLKVL